MPDAHQSERDAGKRKRRPGKGGADPKLTRGLLLWVLLILSVLLFTSYRRPWGSSPRVIDMARFDEHLSRGEIGKAWLTDNELKGTLAKPVADYTRFTVVFPQDYLDRQKVDEIRAKVQQFEVKPRENFWPAVILNIVPWLLLPLLIWFLFFRQVRIPGGTGSVLAFGKSRAKLASKDRTRVTFDDVAGVDEAKQEVREIVEFLKNPSKFQRLGGRIPRGVMLIGPPGTGKTLLAKAIAGEADVPFFSICGADFVEMFVGVGASRVRDLFRQAKENSPCIVFLDEVDAVGRRRGSGLGGGHDEREQTLNAILVEMDGFERDDGVITIAATNRPDVLDPALLRPGRFDREIVLDLADIKGREEILKVHARKVKMGPDVDLKVLARGTPMFSGADLEAVVNEAAILATMAGKELVGMEELEESRDKVKWGKQKRAKIMTEEDRRVTAFHESGHALVSKLHPKVEPLHKVTIIPRGTALGVTMSLPEADKYHMKRAELLGNITLLLAGRVAEQVFCGDVSTGAESDFRQATEIARRMVCNWGMSDAVGPVNYSDSEEHLFLGREVTRTKTHSEAMAIEIDREIKRIVDSCYMEAEKMIREHETQTRRIAEALLKYESLSANDVDKVMDGQDLGDRNHAAASSKPATSEGSGQP